MSTSAQWAHWCIGTFFYGSSLNFTETVCSEEKSFSTQKLPNVVLQSSDEPGHFPRPDESATYFALSVLLYRFSSHGHRAWTPIEYRSECSPRTSTVLLVSKEDPLDTRFRRQPSIFAIPDYTELISSWARSCLSNITTTLNVTHFDQHCYTQEKTFSWPGVEYF